MRFLNLLPVLASLAHTSAYSSGAPRSACDSLRPSHGPASSQLAGARPPYVIKAPAEARPGQVFTVTLGGAPFKGFMVRALDSKANSVGRFVPGQADNWQAVKCQSLDDTATHQRGPDYTEVQLKWEAPSVPGNYRLVATVVQEYSTYYTDYYTDIKVSAGGRSSEEVGAGAFYRAQGQHSVPGQHLGFGLNPDFRQYHASGHHLRRSSSQGGRSGHIAEGNGKLSSQRSRAPGIRERFIAGQSSSGNGQKRHISDSSRGRQESFVGNRFSTSYRPEAHPRIPVSPHHYNPSSNPFQPKSPHF